MLFFVVIGEVLEDTFDLFNILFPFQHIYEKRKERKDMKEKSAPIKKLFFCVFFFVLLSGIIILIFPKYIETMKKGVISREEWEEKVEKMTPWEDLMEFFQSTRDNVLIWWRKMESGIGENEKTGKILPFLVTCDACLPCAAQTITSDFGKRTNPISFQEEYHKGIDLAAAEGQEIYAGWPGVIKECGFDEIYGNYIIITHSDGFESKYAHLSHTDRKEGDFVQAGEKIGEAGKTGWATGSHLHFEVMIQGRNLDPKEYLPLC